MLVTLFVVLITVQFIVVALHDLVHIPGWTHGRQVKAAIGPRNVLIGTLINSIFPGLAAAFALYYYWHHFAPTGVETYWVGYCGVTVASAIAMWWIPYFFGASQKTKDMYSQMYAGTYQVLPPRGDNPRPNVLHLFFHALFVTTFALSLILRF
jgi:hypothetical protein